MMSEQEFAAMVAGLLDPRTSAESIREIIARFRTLDQPEALHALRIFKESARAEQFPELLAAVEECFFWNLAANEQAKADARQLGKH